MAHLVARLVESGQVTQGHGKNKEIERREELLIVISRNVEQNNSPRPSSLIVAAILESANRVLRGASKECVDSSFVEKMPVMTARGNGDDLGIRTGNLFKKSFGADMLGIWETREQK